MTTHVGSSTPGTTSCTLPSHQAGDLILLWAYRDGSNTLPSVPSGEGWVALRTGGANTNSAILAAKVAQSSSEGVGTWTGATTTLAEIYRPGTGKKLAVGAFEAATGSGTSVTYPALSLIDTSGASWIAAFAGHRSTNTALSNDGGVVTLRSNPSDGTDEAASFDTNAGVTSWAGGSISVGGTSSGWRTTVVEIVEYEDELADWAAARDHPTDNAIWLAYGHSHVAGQAATGDQMGSDAASGTYSRQVSDAFTACPAHGVAFIGDHNAAEEGATTSDHDSHLSFTAGAWIESFYDDPPGYNVGGSWWFSIGAGTFSADFGISFDQFRVYHPRYSSGTEPTVNINGGSSLGTLDTNGADAALIARDFTGLSLGAHTINIVGSGGFGQIAGIVPSRSDQKQAIFINAGFSGSKASDWVQYLDELAAIDRHGTSIHLEGNDMLTGRTVEQYEADMVTLVAEARPHGSVIVISSVFIDPTIGFSQSTQAGYHDAAARVASVFGCAYIRGTDQTGFANYNAGLMDADGVHMPEASYWTAYGAPLLALLDAAAEEVTGTGAATLAITPSGTGVHGVAGTGAASLVIVPAGEGEHTAATVTGTGAVTLAVVPSGSGAHGVAGAGAVSLTITPAGTGEFTSAEVTGTGAVTLSVTPSGTGAHGVSGAGAAALAITPAGAGAHGVAGQGAATLGITPSGEGTFNSGYTGTGAVTLSITPSGQGAHGVAGQGAAALAITPAGAGTFATPITGVGAAPLIIVPAGLGTFTLPAGWFPVDASSAAWTAADSPSETWTPVAPTSTDWEAA